MCTLVLNNLPDGVEESEIKEKLFRISGVEEIILLPSSHKTSANYECLVKLDISNPIISMMLAERINKTFWLKRKISARVLLFSGR